METDCTAIEQYLKVVQVTITANIAESLHARKIIYMLLIALKMNAVGADTSLLPIRIEGSLSYSIYSRDQKVELERKIQFSVLLSNRFWNVSTLLDTGYIEEAGSDGMNVYQVLRPPEATIATNRLATPASIANSADYPERMAPFGKVVWLAFASETFFDRNTNSIMQYPWLGHFDGFHRYELTRSERVPRLPINISFWYDPASKESKKAEHNAISAIAGRYSVIQMTNLDSELEVPLEFELRRYRIPFTPEEKRFESLPVLNLFRARVTNVVAFSEGNFVPALARKTSVRDARYFDHTGTVKSIRYIVTNDTWRGADDPMLVAKLSAKIDEEKLRAAALKSKGFRWFYLFFFTVLSALPLIVLQLRKLRRK